MQASTFSGYLHEDIPRRVSIPDEPVKFALETSGKKDLVYRSAQFSVLAQIVFGLLSLLGFLKVSSIETYPTLLYLLIADTVVQVIELVFYLIFICYKQLDIIYRYIDWVVTTPIMLLSLSIFNTYLYDNLMTIRGFFETYTTETIIIVVSNFVMLLAGIYLEIGPKGSNNAQLGVGVLAMCNLFNCSTNASLICSSQLCPSRKRLALFIGFLALLGSFGTIFYSFTKTVWSVILTSFLFLIWAGYGVASIFSVRKKTIAYNILDVFSKNIYGVIVSIVILTS